MKRSSPPRATAALSKSIDHQLNAYALAAGETGDRRNVHQFLFGGWPGLSRSLRRPGLFVHDSPSAPAIGFGGAALRWSRNPSQFHPAATAGFRWGLLPPVRLARSNSHRCLPFSCCSCRCRYPPRRPGGAPISKSAWEACHCCRCRGCDWHQRTTVR